MYSTFQQSVQCIYTHVTSQSFTAHHKTHTMRRRVHTSTRASSVHFVMSHFSGEAWSLTQTPEHSPWSVSHSSTLYTTFTFSWLYFTPSSAARALSVPLLSRLNTRLLLVAFLSFGAWKDTKTTLFHRTALRNLPSESRFNHIKVFHNKLESLKLCSHCTLKASASFSNHFVSNLLLSYYK